MSGRLYLERPGIREPEEAAEESERETAGVQVQAGDEASSLERFRGAAALYQAWAEGLAECIYAGYHFGTGGETATVVQTLQKRVHAILETNAARMKMLQELWDECVEDDDSLPHVMGPEEDMSSRLKEALERWTREGASALTKYEDESSLGGMTEAELAGAAAGLERKLSMQEGEVMTEAERARAEAAVRKTLAMLDGGDADDSRDDSRDDSSGGGDSDVEVSQEERMQRIKEERERIQQERRSRGGASHLRRVSTALAAEEMETLRREAQAKKDAEGERGSEEIAKTTADEGAAHKAEIEALKARNEGVVSRMAELSRKSEAEEAESRQAEHRAEIAKLKVEGESIKARMARLQEEREREEAQVTSGTTETRQELERMREQQRGRAKKSAKKVLSPEEKEQEHLLHREEIEKMRQERSNRTRALGSELLTAAEEASSDKVREDSGGPHGDGQVAQKFLSEAERREQERVQALLDKHEKEEIVVSAEVSSMLETLEKSIAQVEEEKERFQSRARERDQKRSERDRMRQEQAARQQQREQQKQTEEDEFAQWQAERKRQRDEKKRLRDIALRSERGELPKYRIGLVGPKSGKSAMAKRFTEGTFELGEEQTAIDKTFKKPCTIKGSECLVELLDTTSMEEFQSFRKGWYASCDGFLAFFDLTRKPSRQFKKLRAFGEDIKKAKGCDDLSTVPIVVIATKEDLYEKRKCKAGEAVAFAKEWGARYVEVSSMTGENVDAAVETLVQRIAKKE